MDGREFEWWDFVRSKVPSLAAAGFTSLWLPPAHKAANISGPSMGYDPYDPYDPASSTRGDRGACGSDRGANSRT